MTLNTPLAPHMSMLLIKAENNHGNQYEEDSDQPDELSLAVSIVFINFSL